MTAAPASGGMVTRLAGWRLDGAVLRLSLAEEPAVRSHTGGWLTGSADGVEVRLPNLPARLPVPDGVPGRRDLTVEVVDDAVVRFRCGPALPDLGVLVVDPAPRPVEVLDTGDGLVLSGPGVAVRVRARPFGVTLLGDGGHVAGL
jgi:hypothetical protein